MRFKSVARAKTLNYNSNRLSKRRRKGVNGDNMQNKSNRGLMAVAGVLVLLLAGMIYSWSVLSRSIKVEFPDWTSTQMSNIFTLLMAFFCIGIFIAGFTLNKFKPRGLLLISAVCFIAGFLIASRAQSVGMLIFGFSILCGVGSGLAYNGVMASVAKWFPDKKGFISGLLLMGFGFSGFLVGKLFQAFTPETVGGWRGSFVVMGIACAIVVALGSFFVRLPKPEDLAGLAGTQPAGGDKAAAQVENAGQKVDFTTGEMLKNPKFWLFYIWTVANTMAGLVLIAQASGAAAATNTALEGGAIATIVGLISIANGGGRIVVGWLFDRVGRAASMNIINGAIILSGVVLILALKSGSMAMLILGFILLGFGYGGAPVCNAAFVSSSFGLKNYAMNLSVINTCLLVASVGSTISGMIYDATGSYNVVYLFMIGLAVLATVAGNIIVPLERK